LNKKRGKLIKKHTPFSFSGASHITSMIKSTIILSLLALSQGFSIAPSTQRSSTALKTQQSDEIESRRQFFTQGSAAAIGVMGFLAANPEEAFASGGATAGKYTTIPIAKRYVLNLQ
jgi:hypothetical protein